MKNLAIKRYNCLKFSKNKWIEDEIAVPNEVDVKIFLNNKKLVNILCTPVDVEDLIIGFLFAEGIIEKYSDINEFIIDEKNFKVSVIINKEFSFSNNELTYTSGFGKGIMLRTEGKIVNSDFKIKPENIIQLMEDFQNSLEIYKISGAVHASCLASKENVLVVKEDIGRHNTFDKIVGECLKKNLKTSDKIVFTTGRISTEMLLKSSRLNIPVVVTMKSPTANTVKLAEKLNIAVIGKVKNNSLVVFCNKWRVYN